MALTAGFGLDLESCDPMIMEELMDLLAERRAAQEQDRMLAELHARGVR